MDVQPPGIVVNTYNPFVEGSIAVLTIATTALVTYLIARKGWEKERESLQGALQAQRTQMHLDHYWSWYRELMDAASNLAIGVGHFFDGNPPEHVRIAAFGDIRKLSGAMHFLGRTNALASYALRDLILAAGPVMRRQSMSDEESQQRREQIAEATDRLHRCLLLAVGIKPDEYAEEIVERYRRPADAEE